MKKKIFNKTTIINFNEMNTTITKHHKTNNNIEQCIFKDKLPEITNYKEIQELDLNLLITSYLLFEKNNDNSKFTFDALINGNEEIVDKKYVKFDEFFNLFKKYISDNYEELVKNNSLKKKLIYFHIKKYITYLIDDYYTFDDSSFSLEINSNVLCNNKLFYLCHKNCVEKKNF
jgi:hypothetical protein